MLTVLGRFVNEDEAFSVRSFLVPKQVYSPSLSKEGVHVKNSIVRDLPRSIISRDARSVERLISALSLGGPAATATWRFLMRLPTNPDMLNAVRSLERVRGDDTCGSVHNGNGPGEKGVETLNGEKWKALLGLPGSHQMLYMLQIVEGVLEYVTSYAGGKGTIGGIDQVGVSTSFDQTQSTEWKVNPWLLLHLMFSCESHP